MPFNQFVLKVHSRCNLACDYCYMYEMADQGWRNQPAFMPKSALTRACQQIADHAHRFNLRRVSIVLHGGEPLLAGPHGINAIAQQITEIVGAVCAVDFGLQTNGTLLNEQFLEVFHRWNIKIGVSLDGDQSGNDRHRRYRSGRGSHDKVARGLRLLAAPEHRTLYTGLLCTIDIRNNPIDTYEALLHFAPPGIDLMLPHATWTSPPPHTGNTATQSRSSAPYGDWLVAVFDRWYHAETLETQVRIFDSIIDLLLGGPGITETVGLTPVQLAVVETDGTIEQLDVLKSTFAGATKLHDLGSGNPLDAAMWYPSVLARQIGLAALSDTCQRCTLRDICGGGYYPHRYDERNGFRNPSVYCGDLTRIIEHIRAAVAASIPHVAEREPAERRRQPQRKP